MVIQGSVRILVADDHEVVREGLGHLLSGESGFELVGFARDGEEAVTKAESERPDVILMDLVMPVLDGVGAIERKLRLRVLFDGKRRQLKRVFVVTCSTR